MYNADTLKQMLNNIRYRQTEELHADEQAIGKELKTHADAFSNLTIKSLSVAGGILASLAFLTFLSLTKLLSSDTGLMITGLAFFAGSLFASRWITHLLADTSIICLFVLSYILTGMGLYGLTGSDNYVILILLGMSLLTLFISERFFLLMIAVVVFIGSLIAWLILQKAWTMIQLPILVTGISLFVITYYEPAILSHNRKANVSYKALQAGFFLAFLLSLVFIAHASLADIVIHKQWMLSVFIWAGIILLTHKQMKNTAFADSRTKALIYALVFLLIIPTLFAPYLCGALFLVLLTFAYGYRTECIAGGILFIYGIVRYYYDLDLTLLTKSLILMATGILFTGSWFLFRKKMESR